MEAARGPVVFVAGLEEYAPPQNVIRVRSLHSEPGFEVLVETAWLEAQPS